MNIWAIEGHKVRVTEDTMKHGRDHDKRQIQLCELNREYTVSHTEVSNCSTTIYLKEFPRISFNSVNFEDAVEQSEEDDRLHEDWARYNEEDEE